MEAAAGRGGSLPALSSSSSSPSSSSHPPRKEWRVVAKEVQDELLQGRLEEISKQRKELQNVEIELMAQAIARSEISEVQNSLQLKLEEHVDAACKLKEQLEEKAQHVHELDMKLQEKDRELCAIKLDNEVAWAKDDLLREQNNELATFRRERDNSEAERAQRLKQIHDLQEHIQEKETQFLALEEQHRVAQETILLKDEQLREAQSWIARAQQMEVLQSTSLQAELRERTEQFNQCWIGIHQQFAEVDRHHLQVIQQLQLELAEARERNGTYKEGAKVSSQNSGDSTSNVGNKGSQINAKDVGAENGYLSFMSNGNLDGHPYASSSSVSSENEQAAGVTVVTSPIFGMGVFIPPNQITAMHPFGMHPQAAPQSVSSSNSHIPQPLVGRFEPTFTLPPHQHWQQEVTDASQNPVQNNYQPSLMVQNLSSSETCYVYEYPAERQVPHSDNPNVHIDHNQQQTSSAAINGSSNEGKGVLESNNKQYQASQESQKASIAPSHPTLLFTSAEQENEITVQDQSTVSAINQSQEKLLAETQQRSASFANISAAPNHSIDSNNVTDSIERLSIFPESASVQASMPTISTLLDERSLLACIVRAIPAGADGQIRISTTLPNRLAKMLAPLHWHDCKKQYGKLDDFVAHHPELFIIEGDFIQLREGAQEIISATTAFAKVMAAAASSVPHSSIFPSVALTPVAQSHHPQYLKHTQQPNGASFNIAKGLSDTNISVKSKNLQEANGLAPEVRPALSSVQNVAVNGANKGNKGSSNGRFKSGGKQARSAGAGVVSRR